METKSLLWFFFTSFIRLGCVKSKYFTISDILNSSAYNAKERPPATERKSNVAPVKVTLRVAIGALKILTNQEQHFISVMAEVDQVWTDERLIFPDSAANDYLITRKENEIWMPDVSFVCEKEFLNYNPEKFTQIFSNGTVRSSIRVHLKISPIKGNSYTTAVRLLLVSVYSTTEEVVLHWDEDVPVRLDTEMRLGSHLSDPLTSKDFEYGSCDSKGLAMLSKPKPGNYSCLFLQGKSASTMHSLPTVFIPTGLCVVLSWVSFWMNKASFLGRFTIPTLALLHLLNHKINVLYEVVLVQDPFYLNSWIYTCIIFVALSFLQVVTVSFLYGMSIERYGSWNRESSKVSALREADDELEPRSGKRLKPLLACFPLRADDALNAISRCLFPVAFLAYGLAFSVSM